MDSQFATTSIATTTSVSAYPSSHIRNWNINSQRSVSDLAAYRLDTTVVPFDIIYGSEECLKVDLRKAILARQLQPDPREQVAADRIVDRSESMRTWELETQRERQRSAQLIDLQLQKSLEALRAAQAVEDKLRVARMRSDEEKRRAAEDMQRHAAEETEREMQRRAAEDAERRAGEEAERRAGEEMQRQADEAERRRTVGEAETGVIATAVRKTEALSSTLTHAPSTSSSALPESSSQPSPDVAKMYDEQVRALNEHVAALQGFLSDPQRKQVRVQIVNTLNGRIGKITALKRTIDVATRDILLLLGRLDSDSQVLAFAEWKCATLLADSSINIQAKHDGSDAWPVAHVCARIFEKRPHVYKLFQALMYKTCRYLAPLYAPFNADRKQYCLSRGQFDTEDEEVFIKRMAGYMRLWLSLLVLRCEYSMLWQWWSRILNQKARRETPSLLVVALEMSGQAMLERYGRQWKKLIACVERHFLPEACALRQQLPTLISAVIPRVEKWVEEFNAGKRCRSPPGKVIQYAEESALSAAM